MDVSARFVFRLLSVAALCLFVNAATHRDSSASVQVISPALSMQDLGDFDNDGLPNHNDPDDDNDGVEDELDPEPFNPDVWEIAAPVEEPSVSTPEPTQQVPETPTDTIPDDEVIVAEPPTDAERPAPVQVSSLPDTGAGVAIPSSTSLHFLFSSLGLLMISLIEIGRRKRST